MEKLKKTKKRINNMINSLNLNEENDLEKFNILSNLQEMVVKLQSFK
ncbi:hypothetical protein [Clostridium perfringens]|uniref:Uncharacterized protein n=1 Tax=Clostridium perfringens TaxID=1502 RepID=A0A140GRK0_CLOPF|nr:hypothetical protein [Clostridium perfringens]AMN31159.1 hypothetical protein JFP838_pA0243 [Clostridium perfringens]